MISVLSVKSSSVNDTQIFSFLTHLSLHALWSRYGDFDDEVVGDADDDDADADDDDDCGKRCREKRGLTLR